MKGRAPRTPALIHGTVAGTIAIHSRLVKIVAEAIAFAGLCVAAVDFCRTASRVAVLVWTELLFRVESFLEHAAVVAFLDTFDGGVVSDELGSRREEE